MKEDDFISDLKQVFHFFFIVFNLTIILDLETIGNTFLRLCLECIYVWSKIFASNETYVAGYNYLLEKGVKFPEDLVYFKKEEIEIHEENIVTEELKNNDNHEILIEKINYLEKQKKAFLSSLQENKSSKNLTESY